MSSFDPNQSCPLQEVTAIEITTPPIPQINGYKWLRNIDSKDTEVSTAKLKSKVKISLDTKNMTDVASISVIIIDVADNSELSTVKITKKDNNFISDEIEIDSGWNNKELIVKVKKDENVTEEFVGDKKLAISCCEHALVFGDTGDLVKELNIRLAGFGEFGCPLPQSKFDNRTEKAVKQFQRDYMKVAPTGIACKDFLEKLDEFCNDYYIRFETDSNFNIKCPCTTQTTTTGTDVAHRCEDGFGKGRASLESPKKSGPERPGVHRSLLWAISAMRFYLDKIDTTDNIGINKFSSGYRCIADNIRHRRNSTNHMGNAIDINLSGSGDSTSRSNKVRELFAIHSGACIRWAPNGFNLEPGEAAYRNLKSGKTVGSTNANDYTYEFTASTWVHIDCREDFGTNGKADALYCKLETNLKGTGFILEDLISTSDNGVFSDIKNCSYVADEETYPNRDETLWLGVLKDTYTIEYSSTDKTWKPKHESTIPNSTEANTFPRKQDVVIIIEEDSSRYKIKPRRNSTTSIGWIDKKYIKQICKYEKTEE